MVRQEVSNKGRTKAVDKSSPTANISKIGSLKRFSDQEYANYLLHQVAKLVAPILHMNKFKVGALCEMYPKNPNLLGLNVNRGQKILIRLRYHSNDKRFYPLGDLIGTMLHELTHNLYGPHDAKFYKFLDGLKKDFENPQYGTLRKTNYVCEEQTLGSGYSPRAGYMSVREKRIVALSAHKFKSESRRLGTSSASATSSRISKPSLPTNADALRRLILEATERRIKDSKWCPTADGDTKDIEPDNVDLDIIVVYQEEENEGKVPPRETNEDISGKKIAEYKEVIDLTNEEYEGHLIEEDKVVVIEGCEKEAQKDTCSNSPPVTADSPKELMDKVQTSENDVSETTVGIHPKGSASNLLPPFDEEIQHTPTIGDEEVADYSEPVQYSISPSFGRTFIYEGSDEKYPRRKLVADLDFAQIIKKSDKIHIANPVLLLHEDLSWENTSSRLEQILLQEQEILHIRKDPSLKELDPQTNQLRKMESNSKRSASISPKSASKNVSENASKNSPQQGDTKGRKSELNNDPAKNAKKAAMNAKRTTKKAEKPESTKKRVKSIDFEDLFGKQ